MTRAELTLAIAAALFAAFCLGWLACWMAGRFARAATTDLTAMDRLAQSLHEAEEARDEALARADRSEAEHAMALTALEEVRSESDALQAWIEHERMRS